MEDKGNNQAWFVNECKPKPDGSGITVPFWNGLYCALYLDGLQKPHAVRGGLFRSWLDLGYVMLALRM